MLIKKIKFNCLFSNPLRYNIYVFFTLFAFITFVSGCTIFTGVSRKTKNITRGFKERDEDMKKMIGMAPFNNRTRFSDPNLETNFSETLVEDIESSCSGVHILHSRAVGYPPFLGDLPKQGQGVIDNLELAKEGRPFGLNAILTIAFTGINDFEEEKGFWWFKDTHYFIRVQIRVEMYDTETGTKLLDEIINRDIEVELFDIELLKKQKRFDVFLLEEAYEYFASTIAEKVCDALIVQPWKGYIVSVAGNKIILSSGETSGLALEQVLEVFDSSEIIQGADGHRFFMPGPKTGEIKITAVYEDSAEAVLGIDSVVQVGNLVKTKD
jgi:hypothetical protein